MEEGGLHFEQLNSAARVQMFRADGGTVHNHVALIEFPVAVCQLVHLLLSLGISRIADPAIGLQQHCGAKIIARPLLAPPPAWAGACAARTQNALVEPVQAAALRLALEDFVRLCSLRSGEFEPQAHRLVLLEEVAEIGDEILHDWHVWKRIDRDLIA